TVTFGNYTLTTSGSVDFFIVKYDSAGNVLWAKEAGGAGPDYSRCISTDRYGNAYVAGSFASSSITFGSNTLTNAGDGDVFITKYDTAGNVVWANAAGGAAYDVAYGIGTDTHGNSFITGTFASSSIAFGPYTLGNNTTSDYDYFIVKYDSAGNAIWAHGEYGASDAQGYAVNIDGTGNAYVAGSFGGTSIILGSTVTLYNSGAGNLFVVKYDTSGKALWAKDPGGSGGDVGQGISTDANGNVYVVGNLTSTNITFGNTVLGYSGTAGGSSTFVAKIAACVLPSRPVAADQRICAGNSTILSATGTGTFGWYSADTGGTYLGGGNNFATPVLDSITTFYVQDSTCLASSRKAVTVHVNPKPTAIITPSSNDTLVAGTFVSYQWLLNGSPIAGATGASYVVSANGNYQVVVTDTSGCMDTSAVYNFILLGTIGASPLDNIHLYPNPSNGSIYFSGLKNGEAIEIYNALGQMVYSSGFTSPLQVVDMSANAKGIYLYRITDNHLIIQQGKMVLE
ncbi:MAG: type sorting protein, partial [Bacteroidota bacterium]|nr:type sorting protein [Bacteroidota bacterium]